MWCDAFDGDLYALVPRSREVLASLAEVKLWTTGHETGGKINLPSSWHHDGPGLVSFFGLTPDPPQPSYYYSGNPLVACTLEEAVRDLWAHSPHLLRLRLRDGKYVDVWDSGKVEGAFWRLLYLARGWTQLAEARGANVERDQGHVLANLHALVRQVREMGLLPSLPTAATPAKGAA